MKSKILIAAGGLILSATTMASGGKELIVRCQGETETGNKYTAVVYKDAEAKFSAEIKGFTSKPVRSRVWPKADGFYQNFYTSKKEVVISAFTDDMGFMSTVQIGSERYDATCSFGLTF